MLHTPVLLKEVIEKLYPQNGKFFVDGTVDGGGYAKEIIGRMNDGGIFLGIELDKELLAIVRETLERSAKENRIKLILENENYAKLKEMIKERKLPLVDGLVLDLGFSSWHIEKSKRGFSFNKNEPLLMVYNSQADLTAYEVVNFFSERKLTEIICKYGEERKGAKIAKEIVKRRKIKKITTSKELSEIITSILGKKGKIHPATKTFQALRIYINKELENLEKILTDLPEFMQKEGRVVIVSFHSLEDRIVKNCFRKLVRSKKAILLNKKPVCPSKEEVKNNPRSRSAKLRAIKFI